MSSQRKIWKKLREGLPNSRWEPKSYNYNTWGPRT